MRSVQLVAPRRLEEAFLPDAPEPQAGELLVRVRAVGICGSDLHWYLDGRIGRSDAVFPQVLGHEPVCEVVHAGANSHGFRAGDRVAVEPNITCGHCEFCLIGFHNNCVHGFFMGGPRCHGFFREYAVVPAHNAMLVPDSLSDAQATLIEPVAVMAHMLELITIRVGDTVAITGAGPIGLLCAAIARRSGASRVFLCDRVDHRLALAEKTVADRAVKGAAAFVEAVMDETNGRGVDVAIEAAGESETINAAMTVARCNGTVVLIGLSSELIVPFDIHQAMGKELKIQALRRSNHCTAKAIALLQGGAIPDGLITHSFPLSKTAHAFDMLANHEGGAAKIVIEAGV